MSGRYLICIGGTIDEREALIQSGLPCALRTEPLTVWADGPVIPIGRQGCLIGHLFSNQPPRSRVDCLDSATGQDIVRTHGRSLLRGSWGGYVAAFHDEDGIAHILRDPSAAMPCIFGAMGKMLLVSDDAGSIVSLKQPAPRVDYIELARFIASPNGVGRETCLAGISELIGGEKLRVAGSETAVEALWSPWDYAAKPASISFGEAVAELRQTLLGCIESWSRVTDSIVLGVSGGLDSSIVAAGIARANPNLRCLTMVGPDPDGDETHYARALTDSLGVPLTTWPYRQGHIDLLRPILPHLPRPNGSYFVQEIEHAHRSLALDHPIDALFAGNGGDAIFCLIRSVAPLVDRMRVEGLSRGAFQTLKDIEDLTEVSWPTIIRQAFRTAWRHSSGDRSGYDVSGLRPDIVAKLETGRSRHPWMQLPPGALPGKVFHVGNVMRAQRGIEFYSRGEGPPQIAPLLSQPIMELCLRLPTWHWIAGGVERAVARAAFRGILPDVLLDRRSKGGPGGFMHALCRDRCEEIRGLLRGGLLVANGVIDPDFIEQPYDPGWQGKPWSQRLMALGAAETWVRYWDQPSLRSRPIAR